MKMHLLLFFTFPLFFTLALRSSPAKKLLLKTPAASYDEAYFHPYEGDDPAANTGKTVLSLASAAAIGSFCGACCAQVNNYFYDSYYYLPLFIISWLCEMEIRKDILYSFCSNYKIPPMPFTAQLSSWIAYLIYINK